MAGRSPISPTSTSAAVAVTLSARRHRQRARTAGFALVSLVFVSTTVANIVERPDGIRIAARFIAGILLVSVVSRVARTFQIRATDVTFDDTAAAFISDEASHGEIRIIAHEPDGDGRAEYRAKNAEERHYSHIPRSSRTIFLEIHPSDSSDFEEELTVHGQTRFGYRVLSVTSGTCRTGSLLRMDRGQPDLEHAQVPLRRFGRGRDDDAGGAAQG